MKIIDRYIGKQFVGPFFVGVAAFVGILLGVGEIFEAVKLVVRDGFPLMLVLENFLLRIPTVIALTMPMATVFAALMCSGEISAHGEVVAMRAGGISVWRLAVPVLLAGVGVSVLAFGIGEVVAPACNAKSTALLNDYIIGARDVKKEVWFKVPAEGEAQRLVYSDRVDLKAKTMYNVTIVEFGDSDYPDTFVAEQARWQGKKWQLENVLHKHTAGKRFREDHIDLLSYDLGRSLDEVWLSRKKRYEDLSIKELIEESRSTERVPPAQAKAPFKALQHLHLRIATPWAALCFVVLGFPLGMRPQRTSAGIGFGISLAIIFVYYIVFNVLRAFGEQGDIAPFLAAWLPNIVVLGIGLGLMIDTSR